MYTIIPSTPISATLYPTSNPYLCYTLIQDNLEVLSLMMVNSTDLKWLSGFFTPRANETSKSTATWKSTLLDTDKMMEQIMRYMDVSVVSCVEVVTSTPSTAQYGGALRRSVCDLYYSGNNYYPFKIPESFVSRKMLF